MSDVQSVSRSADVLARRLTRSSEAIERLRANPEATIRDELQATLEAHPFEGDRWLYRLVIGFLGSTVTIVAIGTIALAFQNENGSTPEGLVALGSAAVGALAGLLVPSPGQKR